MSSPGGGGERFEYDASYYAQTAGLTSQPIVLPVPAAASPTSGYTRDRYRDFTTNLGGPAVRDRLWFFGGYQYLRDYDSQPGVDPTFPRTYEQDKVFAKLTWQLTPGMQLMQSFHQEFWVNPPPPTTRDAVRSDHTQSAHRCPRSPSAISRTRCRPTRCGMRAWDDSWSTKSGRRAQAM